MQSKIKAYGHQTLQIIIGPTQVIKHIQTHAQGDTKGSRRHSWFTLKGSNGWERRRGKEKLKKIGPCYVSQGTLCRHFRGPVHLMAYRLFLYPTNTNYTILQFPTNKGQIRLKPCVCMAAWVTKALLIYGIKQFGFISYSMRPNTDFMDAGPVLTAVLFSMAPLRRFVADRTSWPRFSSRSCHCHKSVSECLSMMFLSRKCYRTQVEWF